MSDKKVAWKYIDDKELSSHKVVVIPTRGYGKHIFMQELFSRFMYRMPYRCSNYYYASCKSLALEDVLEYDYYREKLKRYMKETNYSKYVGKYVRLTLNDEPEPIEGRLEYGKFFEADGCDYWVYMEDGIVRGIPRYRIKEIEEI